MNPRIWDGLLCLGALLGAGLAALNILVEPHESLTLPEAKVIARVNGEVILRADFERALRAVSAQLKGKSDSKVQKQVLDRLIDEVLLVQYGVELGLASREPLVRTTLSSAVIDLLVARAFNPPDESTLRHFYAQNRDYFSPSVRVRVAHKYFESRAAYEAKTPGRPPLALPQGFISAETLRTYLGPASRKVLELQPGQSTAPFKEPSGSGLNVLELLERKRGEAPPLQAIRAQVIDEFVRRAGDDAVREFLKARRARAELEVAL